jgi:ribosome hibernation promoting factor
MRIDVTGRQVEVTPALRKYAETKLKKLERLLDGPLEAHVVLAIEKHRHMAEIQVKSRTALLSGMRETGDLYASIGEVADRLERQALKHKEKLTSRKKRGAKRAGLVPEAVEPEPAAKPRARAKVAAASPKPRLFRSERYRLKPLSADDAVMELESGKDDLLVYRDAQTYRVNVVYRRKDGNFGVVDPEF